MLVIFTSTPNVEATIGGDKKITLILRDKDDLEAESTQFIIGDDWEAFQQDDAIKVLVSSVLFQTTLVYFNTRFMRSLYLAEELK
jgi:hypothetical protein